MITAKKATARKPRVQFVGQDGNVFAILGRCRQALRKAGLEAELVKMSDRVKRSGSYAEALGVMMEYVDAR